VCPGGVPIRSKITGRMYEDEPLQPPRYIHVDGSECDHVPELIAPSGVESSEAWRENICVCEDARMHVHCPWGGVHVHYIDSEGNDVPPPDGFRHRAVYLNNAYNPQET
jgi:hypothetical protein